MSSHTFSKQGRILSAMLMRIGRTWPSSIFEKMRDNPDIASMVMRSSGSSRSSMPANIALKMVVEKWDTYERNRGNNAACISFSDFLFFRKS